MPSKPKRHAPNRPVDFTVAQTLTCGHVLHKGPCKVDNQIYHGDYRHTRYYVIGIKLNLKRQTFELALVQEYIQLPFTVGPAEALEYHRQEDCASRKRKPNNHKPSKPNSHQQLWGLGKYN